MTILQAAASAAGRAMGAMLGYGLTKMATATAVDCTEAWERQPDAYRSGQRPAMSSPARVEAASVPVTAAGERPAPAVRPTPAGAGHPNLTRSDLQCATFALREFGEQCTTDFGRQFWTGLADKFAAAAERK